ncbi:hypothetical protein BH09PLA1_BH09PLA1_21340 [soil metagenome]
MKRQTLQHVFIAGIAATLAIAGSTAGANPVAGKFVNDARGDTLADLMLTREIGDVLLFPAADAIAYHDHRASFPVGVADDGIANDWTVHMTNVSGQAWRDLFFVADAGATIGNADGLIEDTLAAPGQRTDAFRIDALGVNANLLSESILADGIFQPGEEWEFVVTNFGTGFNSSPPTLTSPGVFSGSSPMQSVGGTNSSILGVVVPEPSTLSIFALMALAALRRRRNPTVQH